MNPLDLEELATSVTGGVRLPADDEYDTARAIWNTRFNRKPDAIARCAKPEDVKASIDFARRNGLLLSVKGGGHAYAANTVGDGGLLIDLSLMHGVRIDAGTRTAHVGAGATWGGFDQTAQQSGLAAPGPTVSTVGVAGSTLGGGSGWLSRKFGLALDNLASVEVVTADGRILRASEKEHPDLFWALRGGGGNFGVATSFEFRLHRAGPDVFAGQIVYPFERVRDALRLYRDVMATAPDELQCYPFIIRIPPVDVFPKEFHGQLAVDFVVMHIGEDGERAVKPFLDFGTPILAAVGTQRYTDVQQSFDAGLPAGRRYSSRSHDLGDLSDGVIEALASGIGSMPGEFTVVYLACGGGAMSQVAPDATAYFPRLAPFSVHILAGWTDASRDAEITGWARALQQALAPYAMGSVYVNLLDADEGDRVRAAYGGNYERLAALKRTWDPENLFRMNHNILPA